MKKLLVVLVVVVILAVMALHQQSRPVTATCGSVSGGQTMTVAGVGVVQKVTRWVRDHADVHKDGQQIKKAIDDLWYKVLWYWIRTGFLSLRGEKIDPQILRLQQQQEASASAARGACGQPCPPSGPAAGPDPASLTLPHRNGLTGAALAADAARRAGFPESEIPMAVAVAKYESGWNPRAVNNWKPNAHMRGMWQIYEEVHRDLMRLGDWRDPYVNARMAFSVWKAAGRSWSPWSTAATARRNLHAVPHVTAALASPPLNDSITPKVQAPCPSPTTPPASVHAPAVTPDGWNFAGNNTVDQAVNFMEKMAQHRTRIPSGRCLHYVGVAYGHNGTAAVHGRHWAIDVFDSMPARYKHAGRSVPPRGALVFWRTGGPGHIAISLGNGQIASTDFNGTKYQAGIIGFGSISALDKWGPRAGWTAPMFRGQTRTGAST